METTSYWNLKDLVCDLLGATAERRPEPRAEIWASDLGKPHIDRWLQMKGVPYSNPPTGEALMTFFLGKQIELGVETMLARCGVAHRAQERLTLRVEGCLPVVGRPDLLASVEDWEALRARLDRDNGHDADDGRAAGERLALSQLLDSWRARAPGGLPLTVFEVKSLNSYAFKHHRGTEGLSNAYPHHKLQVYTYLRALGLEEGHLIYVARDTGWMEEVVVRPTATLEQAWLDDVECMSAYYRYDERPPLEPLAIDGRPNWRVATSRYRDYLYREGTEHGAFAF
ncbi:MAG: hypothetical protein FJZ90_02975 [Chloroflexi bacterium]|nr:hypothetical protein [Chloroflexota bacterium]